MKYKVMIIKNDKIYEITNITKSLKFENSLYDSAGQCELEIVNTDNEEYPNGTIINIFINDISYFYGIIFETSIKMDKTMEILAYDQLRYLKNKDTVWYEGKTASQIFEDICKKNNVQYKLIDNPNWIVLGYLYDKKTMFEIIKHALEETENMEGKKFMIRDNGEGYIEFLDIANKKTNLQIGDSNIVTEFSYTKSIDEDTYNVVKVYRDNKETQKRDVWQTQDSSTIQKWGKLQFLQNVDEQANEEQIKELANNILTVKNRETKTIELTILGFYNLRVGDGIKIKIDKIIDEWVYLSGISTTIEGGKIQSDLEITLI